MKVILLKDVPKLGRKYEVKEVSDGHASNFLIPRSLVEIATAQNLKKLETLKIREREEMKVNEDLLLKNLSDISEVTILMEAVANDKGHLFAGIHKEDLVPLIKEQSHLDVPAEFIHIEKPIKEVGDHEIEVAVQDKTVKFKLIVRAKE